MTDRIKSKIYYIIMILPMLLILLTDCPPPSGGGGGDPRFVAVGAGGLAWWSPDGSAGSWTDSSPDPGGNHIWSVAFRP